MKVKNKAFIIITVLILLISLVLILPNNKVLNFITQVKTNFYSDGNTTIHSNFKSIVVRKDSEYGDVVADITNGDTLTIDPNTDYYLCISSTTPTGSTDGYFQMSVAKDKANGLYYTGIPGQKYEPSEILSDAFDKLLEYTDTEEVKYGSSLTAYSLKDGTLKYSIKEAKMGGAEIYFVFGFKMDTTVWDESEEEIKNAFEFEIGNSTGTTDSMTINATINAEKKLYLSGNSQNINATENVKSSAMVLGLFSPSGYETPIIYGEMGYTITYPKGVVFNETSYSSSSSLIESYSYGTISVSDEVDNGDGTLSRVVSFGPGRKDSGNSSSIFYNYVTFTDELKSNNDYTVIFSDGYYKPYGSDNKVSLPIGNMSTASVKYIAKLFSADDIVDRTTISAINRTGSNAVYNWNLDSYSTSDAINFLGGAQIKNNDTNITEYAKTVKANYNITNENANIAFVTIPVGVDKDGNNLKSINVKYTAIKEDGSEISGTYTPKVITSGSTAFTVFRAVDICAVSIKSIEADIGYLKSKFVTASWGSANDITTNMFAAFGYFTNSNVGSLIKNTFIMVNTDDSAPVNDLKTTSQVLSTDKAVVKFNAQFEKNESEKTISLVAGNSVTLKNKSIGINYFLSGTNETVLLNPELYIIMPKGMSYEGLSISKKITNYYDSSRNSTTKLEIDTNNITYLNKTDDGASIYHVTFKNKDLVLGNNCNKYGDKVELVATVKLNTSKTMTTKVYDFDSLFQLSGESKNISVSDYASSYTTQENAVTDIYNINNGNTLSGTRSWSAQITGLSVQRLDAITVENAISVYKIDGREVESDTRTWDTYDSTNQNSISYLGYNTEGQYRVIIQNPSSSDAENFKMFLPIPKANTDLGTNFMNNESKFNMSLTANDVGDYTIKYVYIEEKADLGTLIDNIKYHETTQDDANAILITKDTVLAGDTNTLYFDFKVTKDDTVKTEASNIWRSYFNYKLDGNTISNNGSYVATEVAVCEVTGTVFADLNSNSRLDTDETGISNIAVTATDSLGRVQFATTDDEGNYSFTNVREDNITIEMEITNGNYVFAGEKKDNTETDEYNNVEVQTNNSKKASASIYTSGSKVKANASINNVYKITYDKNGGNGAAPSAQEITYGVKVTIATPPSGMYQEGTEFIGWSTTKYDTADSNTDKVEYKAGDVITPTEDITLYAVYIPKYYTLTFDLSGGTLSGSQIYESKLVRSGQILRTADSDGKIFPNNPTKSGYLFWKWELAEGEYGKGDAITGYTKLTLSEDITIRAVFLKLNKNEDNLNLTYGDTTTTSFYDLNDLSVDGLPDYYNYGTKYTLASGENLPSGLSLVDGEIIGIPSEVVDKDVKFVATTQVGESSNNTKAFNFTLHISISKKDIDLNLTSSIAGGIIATSEEQAVTLTAKVSGLIDGTNVNENNEVTFVATDSTGIEKTLGKATITNGIATYNWNVTVADIETYKISVKIDSLVDVYNILNNQSIGSFVISEKEIVKYTVIYNTDGYGFTIDDAEYAENSVLGTLPNIKVTGYIFDGWYDSENNKVDENTIVTSDMTIYAKYTAKTYTVNYKGLTKDISIDSKANIKFNDDGIIPETPAVVAGYTFVNWQTNNGNKVASTTKYSDIATEDTNEITLYAVYEANTYTATFDANGGSVGSSFLSIKYDDKFGTLQVPTKSGYNFVGWFDQYDKEIISTTTYTYASNVTITAKWNVKTGYIVKYDSLGGTTFDNADATWESLIDISKTPTRKGYTFNGWLYNDTLVNDTDTYGLLATNDKQETLTLAASWGQNKVRLTIAYSKYDSSLIDEQIEVNQYSITKNLKPITISCSTFEGWYLDKDYINKLDDNYEFDSSITIYPKYTVNKYIVKYAGVEIADKENVLFNDNDLLPINIPTKIGYTFDKFVDENGIEVTNITKYSDIVTDDSVSSITLTAIYKANKYTITYNANNGSITTNTKEVTYDSAIGILEVPTVKGGSFIGWYDQDENLVTDSTIYKTADNIILTAKYEYPNDYKAIFEDLNKEVTINWNSILTIDNEPSKEGYIFAGWLYNDTLINPTDTYGSIVNDDGIKEITLKAKWTEKSIVIYNITFDSLGGTTVNNQEVIENNQIINLPTPVKQGYEFKGWYIDATVTIPFDENTKITKDMKLFAKWEYIYTYEFINGDNQEFIETKVDDYNFRIDGDYTKFVKLLVNSVEYVRDVDYTATEGSTIINFLDKGKEKLNNLDVGVYPVELVYSNGTTVEGSITIKDKGMTTDNEVIENPNTSDNITIYIDLLSISSLGIIILLILSRKEESES